MSALSAALERIGDRWSLLLVEALLDGPRRFADLEAAVAGISTNILTSRLRHLEAAGVLLAVPYSQRPLRYSYELTDTGRDLGGAVRLLAQWSADHGAAGRHAEGAAAPTHATCGTPMDAVWWCPTCERPDVPGDDDVIWI
ncbi:MAG TPA: helix-turn-helix domain-containing protein [Acidimicrobiales bacterium]|jgi:DNA-binding HxlR family transcriptional regulator|nr:helix-turn-helix domain-containing protein [Acidimicrobiales bacterium]